MLRSGRAVVAVCFAVLSACAHQPPEESSQAAELCGAPDGWEHVAEAAEHKVLIFGETHGTAEIPDAFARYVCAASARDGRTLALLEIDVSHEDALASASDASDPRADLIATMSKHWANQDGRGSEAMLDMVVKLVHLRQAGRDLEIRPMDQITGWPETENPEELSAWLANQPPTAIQRMRDAGMAEKIRMESAGFDRTIVLVGNVHARKEELQALPGIDLMAMLIPDAISLLVLHDGGTAWSWTENGPGMDDRSPSNREHRAPNSMALTTKKLPAYPGDQPNFDGYVSVGPITASESAISSGDAP